MRRNEITVGAFSFAANKVERQKVAPDGQPLFHKDGTPQLVDAWVVDIIEQAPTELTITHLLFDQGAKDELLRQLTGGVVVATSLPTQEMAARL